MRLITRAGLAILIAAGVMAAAGGTPGSLAASEGIGSMNPASGATASDNGEIWVTAQNTDEIRILLGTGATETVTLPAGAVSGCGIVRSSDGRTIFLASSGGAGHFYRLDTATDTLTEDPAYGPIGTNLHGLAVAANEKRAYIAAVGDEQVKVLNLEGTEVSAISLDWRLGVQDGPDSIARKGSNIYVTLRFAGQVARIRVQTGAVEYIFVAPPATTGWAVHGIAIRP